MINLLVCIVLLLRSEHFTLSLIHYLLNISISIVLKEKVNSSSSYILVNRQRGRKIMYFL